ncbi:UMP-CMP kinase, putative [Plasmodium reichenowi]|uniref:UMP-CMP kinase, putative n=2 Tax=Plasmodium reichenowi TaxID=5854 RepID=A0A060RMV0_PLARE|nr:UMP-CMP kinase, putative [Plasmodium reichenowi]SOV75002.1 UMP-CMP kinase, putative [Plasmodium reichenowi]
MNYQKLFLIFFFMFIVKYPYLFVKNLYLLKNSKHFPFYINRTNGSYKKEQPFKIESQHYNKITRKFYKFKKNIYTSTSNFSINSYNIWEKQFFSNNKFIMSKDQPFVIFMLGGPGSGKGTQCKLIQEKFDFTHISAGDCLREYLKKCEKNEVNTKHQEIVEDCINNGKIVPVDITLELMKIKMESEIAKRKKQEHNELSDQGEAGVEKKKDSFSFKKLDENANLKNINIEEYNNKLKYVNNIYENKEVLEILKNNKCEQKAKYKFIIDGFPRNYDNFNGWINIIGNYAYVHLCLFLYCDEEIMIERCMNRGLTCGRVDDNMDTLKKRFDTHNNDCIPIINLFLNENKCIFINANKNIQDVWSDIQYVFTNM